MLNLGRVSSSVPSEIELRRCHIGWTYPATRVQLDSRNEGGFCYRHSPSNPRGSMGLVYPSGNSHIPTLRKGKSSTQNVIFGGYVSSLKGIELHEWLIDMVNVGKYIIYNIYIYIYHAWILWEWTILNSTRIWWEVIDSLCMSVSATQANSAENV